jgi:8-oxo-dGTP pyrophosphatase MutT (NUDIX family)
MLDSGSLSRALADGPRRYLPLDNLRPAAVLLPLSVRNGEDWILLTRRTEQLPHHGGEIAFPGGARHEGDADLLQTALREVEEEMGIQPRDVTIFGRLDDFFSVHDYHVTPFVGSYPSPYPFRVNPAEIAEVIELPLQAFLQPGVWHQEDWHHRGRSHPVDFFRIGPWEIWGLTAAILRQFLLRVGLLAE